MLVCYADAYTVRLITSTVQEYNCDEVTQLHIVRTLNSIYTFKAYCNPTAWKRAKAPLYMPSPINRWYRDGNPNPEGHLLAYGKYRTKLYPPDLPEWYIFGYMYKRYGYMSAKGVKHLLYKPNYAFNHLYKDDILFISYDKDILPITDNTGFAWYEGYDYCLSGPIILEFIDAAEKYSHYDVGSIRAEIEKKKEWYNEQNKDRS